MSVLGCALVTIGIIIEILFFLEEKLSPVKSRTLKFVVYPLTASASTIIVYNLADWVSLRYINQATGLNPSVYEHTSGFFLIFGFILVLAAILCGIIILSIAYLLADIAGYMVIDTAKSFFKISINQRPYEIDHIRVIRSIGRVMGMSILAVSMAYLLDLRVHLTRYAGWSVYAFDHYKGNMCKNLNLKENEKIAYIDSGLVSIASWNGFTNNVSFRVEKCVKAD